MQVADVSENFVYILKRCEKTELPFKKDFSDVVNAYVENETDRSTVYVILKENNIVRMEVIKDGNDMIGKIDTKILRIDNISSVDETIGKITIEGSDYLRVTDITVNYNTAQCTFPRPTLDVDVTLNNIEQYEAFVKRIIE